MNFNLNIFLEKVKDFNYRDNGMFNSELFLILYLYHKYNCNFFIESGIDNGNSTEILLKFIEDPYVGIDINPYCAGARISNNNFKFINANSKNIFDLVVSTNDEKNLFILIDGPKGKEASEIKNKLLNNNNILFVACHDTHDGLMDDNHYRIFETMTDTEYNKNYYDLLNLKNNNKIRTVFNVINYLNYSNLTYQQAYPNGPGLSIYSNKITKQEMEKNLYDSINSM